MTKLVRHPGSGRSRFVASVCAAGMALAACGGGGGYGGGSTPPPAPTVTLSVAPTSVVLGQSATLTWMSNTGTSCTASGGWSGSKAATGTASVTPTASGSVTYTLTCSGGTYGGSTAASATLTVTAATSFSATSLVSDTAGGRALLTDANVINPWGIAFGPTSSSWVANNHSGTSTLYDGNGRSQPAAAPLVLRFGASDGVGFNPTGVVYNESTDFAVSAAGKTGPALFVFSGEGGMVAGWSPSVDPGHVVTMYTDAGGAVYKGLAGANNGIGNFLYASDFHNAKVDTFDAAFVRQAPSSTRFGFIDPTLPAGYAPFGIQALKTGAGGSVEIFVTYALTSRPDNHNNVNGKGLGLVDVFDTNGKFLRHLIPVGRRLNAPWGLALAPGDFGTLSRQLLVGNFGDGTIAGYDPTTGVYVGTIADSGGHEFAMPGLRGIAFGNDAKNQPRNTLFYAAGTNNEANGAYGRIDAGSTPPMLNVPPVVAVTAPSGRVSGTVTVTAAAQGTISVAKVELFAGATSLGVTKSPPYSVQWDTTTLVNGGIALTAVATDVDGNVATSPAVSVTVASDATNN